jgi:hypothetical protein
MNGGKQQSRRFGAFLLAAIGLHLALLTIPVVREAVLEPLRAPVVQVRLQAATPPAEPAPEPVPAPLPEPPAEPPPEPAPEPPPPQPRPEPVARQEPPPTAPETEPTPPVITAHRILSDLAEARQREPLSGVETGPAVYAPFRPSLDQVLNEPSLQLPFRDTRVYLVNSYDPGLVGSIDRFFDTVTVPFSFQTKNNTRIQCAWILILAGCSWGDASLYYAADKARKRPPDGG